MTDVVNPRIKVLTIYNTLNMASDDSQTDEKPNKIGLTDSETNFMYNIKSNGKQMSKDAREFGNEQRQNLEKQADKAYEYSREFAQRNAKKTSNFITGIVWSTITLALFSIHASALCYLSMSVNVNNGLGGIDLNGLPFKPAGKDLMKACANNEFKNGVFDYLRNSLKIYGFPYKNMLSCDKYAMYKEPFTIVRYTRWVTDIFAFAFSTGRQYLNLILGFFKDPNTAFWILPLVVPFITMIAGIISPFIFSFSAFINILSLFPKNVFGLLALNPLSAFLTGCAFFFGIFMIPMIGSFIQMVMLTLFFTVFPYILDDKFTFPGDFMNTPYSGFGFIFNNISYRWRSILFVWLLLVASNANTHLNTKDVNKGTVIKINKNRVRIRYDTGKYSNVDRKDVKIDDDNYLVEGASVIMKKGSMGQKHHGVIRRSYMVDGEQKYVVYVENKNGKGTVFMDIDRKHITPVIDKDNVMDLRVDMRIFIVDKSNAGSVISKILFITALLWFIYISLSGSTRDVLTYVLNYVLKFILNNNLYIAIAVLITSFVHYEIESSKRTYDETEE